MKNISILTCLAVSLLVINSCTKDNAPIADSITGSWELRKITGGFRGTYPQKDYASGNGNIFTIADSAYQIYYNHVLLHSGNYSLGKDSSHATGRLTDFLILSGNEKIYFEIENNTMTLFRGELIYDGTIEKYERLVNRQ